MNQPAPQQVPLNCPACSKAYQAQIQAIVLPGSDALEALREGKLNQVNCPHCGDGGILSVPFVLFQPEQGRVLVFAPQFHQMNQQQQQQLLNSLIGLLREVAGEDLNALGEQLEVGVVGQYEAMVGIARGKDGGNIEGEEDGEEDSSEEIDPEIHARLDLLMELMQAAPVQKAALKAQNRELLPELAQLARFLAEQQTEPSLAGMLRGLAQELEASATGSGSIAEPSLMMNRKDFVVKPVTAPGTGNEIGQAETEAVKEVELAAPVRRRQEVLPPEPLNHPAPVMPRLLRLKVAGGKGSMTDTTTGIVTEADFSLPSGEDILRVRELMAKAQLESKEEEDELLKLGEGLYAHLLPGEIGKVFEVIWEEGEPVQLHLELTEAMVQFVPWEYLAKDGEFLARQPNFYLSREAKVGRIKPKGAELTLPLRLLMVVSSPLDLQPQQQLDSDREIVVVRRGVQELLDKGEIEIELEDVASLDKLREALDTFKPHLVHFTGHGYIEADDKGNISGSGLVLEDGQGHKRQVAAKELAGVLANRPDLRAVLLSACVTALPNTDKAIVNTANALVQAGVGAVIAMQESVRDDTATRFARYFYPALAEGQQVSEALAVARQRVAEMEGRASDWGMSVLLTGKPELPLFHFTQKGQPRPRGLINGTSLSVLRQGEGYFVGRQAELRAVREALTGNKEKLMIISGLGGFGKSTLAQRSIERFQTRFGVVQIISCKNWQGLISAVSEIARGLHQAGVERLQQLLADKQRQFGAEELGMETAKALNEVKGLLVLDNFEDLLDWKKAEAFGGKETIRLLDAGVAEWLESLVLNLGEGRVLMTSRYDFSFTRTDRHQSAIGRVHLDKLGWMEAYRLMKEYPELKKLPDKEIAELYQGGIDNPQIIEWADAGRRQQGGGERQQEVVRLQGKFSAEMLLEELYASLPELAQAVLRRIAVYREPLPLEFLSKQQSGASKAIQALRDRNLLRVLNVEEEAGQVRSLYSLHQSVRFFGLDKLEKVEGELGLKAAYFKAAKHYHYFALNISKELKHYLEAKDYFLAAEQPGEAVHLVARILPVLDIAGFWRSGLELGQEMLDLIEKNDTDISMHDQVTLIMNQAVIKHHVGYIDDSIKLSNQALRIEQKVDDLLLLAPILINLGSAYGSKGQRQEAETYFNKAIKVARVSGDLGNECAALVGLGMIYSQSGQDIIAIQALEEALKIADTRNNKLDQSIVYGALGSSYLRLNNYSRSIESYEKLLELSHSTGHQRGEMTAFANLANNYYRQSEYAKAIEYQEKALVLAVEMGGRQDEANTYINLGTNYQAMEKYEQAVSCYDTALSIYQELGNWEQESQVLYYLAMTCLNPRSPNVAIQSFTKRLSIVEAHGRKATANTYLLLSIAYEVSQNYALAVDAAHNTVNVATATNEQDVLYKAYSSLNINYYFLSNYKEALRYGLIALLLSSSDLNEEKNLLEIIHEMLMKIGLKDFERFISEIAIEERKNYHQLRTLLVKNRILTNTTLQEYYDGMEDLFSAAALGNVEALKRSEKWIEEQKMEGAWFRDLAYVIKLILQGERSPSTLLDHSQKLDESDQTLIQKVLSNLERNRMGDTQDEQLKNIAQFLGLGLAGNNNALEVIKQSILPQMENENSQFRNAAVVIRLKIAGKEEEAQNYFTNTTFSPDEITLLELAQEAYEQEISNSSNTMVAVGSDDFLTQVVVRAVQGDELMSRSLAGSIRSMLANPETQNLGIAFSLILAGQREVGSLTKELNEEDRGLILTILEALKSK